MECYQVMKDKFSVTLVNVVNDICRNNSLEDIKQMLVSREANMLIEVEAVKDKVTLTALLRTYCFMSNIELLRFLSNTLKAEQSKIELDDLADEVNNFYERIRAEDFAKAAIKDHETMENREKVNQSL